MSSTIEDLLAEMTSHTYQITCALSLENEDLPTTSKSPAIQQKFTVFKFDGNGEVECPLCYNKFRRGRKVNALSCLHKCHTSCIDSWLKERVWVVSRKSDYCKPPL